MCTCGLNFAAPNSCNILHCPMPSGVSATPSQAVSRSQLWDDPPWVCQLKCKEAEGLNSTWRRLLNPPYQISNYLQRLPLNTKVCQMGGCGSRQWEVRGGVGGRGRGQNRGWWEGAHSEPGM